MYSTKELESLIEKNKLSTVLYETTYNSLTSFVLVPTFKEYNFLFFVSDT